MNKQEITALIHKDMERETLEAQCSIPGKQGLTLEITCTVQEDLQGQELYQAIQHAFERARFAVLHKLLPELFGEA